MMRMESRRSTSGRMRQGWRRRAGSNNTRLTTARSSLPATPSGNKMSGVESGALQEGEQSARASLGEQTRDAALASVDIEYEMYSLLIYT